MKKNSLLVVLALGFLFVPSVRDVYAARVIVGPRGHVRAVAVVRPGFPIRRRLPEVFVVPPPVVAVAPRVYLSPVVFHPVVVAVPAPAARIWNGSENLDKSNGWTDFTLNVDQRGNHLLLDISRGAAQISFAEVVFDNGETQVVDFNDSVHRKGTYTLLDVPNGRRIDHVRVVAKANTPHSIIGVDLIS